MNKILKTVLQMMDCREAQAAHSRQLDGDLGAWNRCRLKFHLKMCWCCRRFAEQLEIVQDLVKDTGEHADFGAEQKLSAESRERISQALEQEAKEKPEDS